MRRASFAAIALIKTSARVARTLILPSKAQKYFAARFKVNPSHEPSALKSSPTATLADDKFQIKRSSLG